MEWFSLLLFYGYREGEEPSLSDQDSQLLPRLVDKVLIPKLTGRTNLSHVYHHPPTVAVDVNESGGTISGKGCGIENGVCRLPIATMR